MGEGLFSARGFIGASIETRIRKNNGYAIIVSRCRHHYAETILEISLSVSLLNDILFVERRFSL